MNGSGFGHEIIRLEKVTKVYHVGTTEQTALGGIDLSVRAGEFVSVAGPSGSGKSTLLNLIGCLDTPTSGKIFVDGTHVGNLKPGQLADLRNEKIGFIFQSFNLIPVLSAFENVEFPLLLQGKNSPKERKNIITEIFTDIGLEDYMQRRPSELSGGQQQRVAIARALIKKPRLILADEPTANLDSANGEAILKIMKDLNRKKNITFVFSTHEKMVMNYASRLILLKDGTVADDRNQNNGG